MPCLICRYFQPAEPPQHKQEREAGRCQSACGNKWDWYTAIQYVRNHGHLDGWCRLHPEAKRFGYNHVCGDISPIEHFHNPHWGVDRFKPDDHLLEWSEKASETVLRGTWREQRAKDLEKQNTELRRQLKCAREISASRLKRLQKNKPAEPKRPAEPFRPRLIAAE